MEEFWARLHQPSGKPGPDYWFYFAERLAHHAVISNGAAILDIGTYDGNVLSKAANKYPDIGYGVGIDIDQDGFYAGIAEANKSGLNVSILFVQMDANALGFNSGMFDNVLVNFLGFDDFYDFDRMEFVGSNKIVSEIIRVLKPGGEVGIGSWVQQSDIDWIAAEFQKYLPKIYASVGKGVVCYSRENPEGQKAILQEGGFADIRVYDESADFVSPDADTWWRQMERAAGEDFRGISDPEELVGFKEQVFAGLDKFRCTKGIRFSKSVSFAYGVKPF